ncbi:MAG: hypothetical protein IKK33_10540 [Lachnospiraceae bacterium]|nr:hypothetical protein [Lachnospiraceae bacterium]
MSMVWNCMERAWEGAVRYMSQNHLIVILATVLLVLWLMEKKNVTTGQNRVLVYSLLMMLLLLCPITAAGVMIYQTGFYDYEWAWSMVPLTIIIAYGFVLLWTRKASRKYKVLLALVVLSIGCLCGNQGQIQRVAAEESEERADTGEIMQLLDSRNIQEKLVVWAPRGIMQEMRRRDGHILLVYGRDMWDEKAGAYDYEAYSQELEEAYLWMEKGTEYCRLTVGHDKPEKALETFVKEAGWDTEAKQHIRSILQAGTNLIVLPNLLSDYVGKNLEELAEAEGKVLQEAYTQRYIIYVIR